jgi:hypothetical protein
MVGMRRADPARLRIPHTPDLWRHLRNAEQALELIHQEFDTLEQTFVHITRVRLNAVTLARSLADVFPAGPVHDDHVWRRTLALRPWLRHYNVERPHAALGYQPPCVRFPRAAQ